ncbi:hypothetical protein OGAPHI_005144 [Ogataea philodendri]|uniref:Defect at low temperature protein 1 n=1 Tax=Ogataea philodendri TaxID=1378263 RepID=A0A9P8P224_9ASCO|nr:uncharacterized protein OGAPHI_005144 [Ogataea philodendri]KAH3663742.1 hypothetical protein OGAPHI_005144 [Ogataea philodendri]
MNRFQSLPRALGQPKHHLERRRKHRDTPQPNQRRKPKKLRQVGQKSRGVLIWLYSISLLIFIVVFLLLNALVPLDLILRSTSLSSLTFIALVVVIASALFLFISAVIYILRILILKRYLQDIPKAYVPITERDIGARESKYISQGIARAKKIKQLARPNATVDHPGLHSADQINDPTLPDNVVYEDVVRAIGEDVRYRHTLHLTHSFQVQVEPNQTLRDIVYTTLRRATLSEKESHLVFDFLAHYEKLRFSGKPISRTDFLVFLSLWNHTKTVLRREL